MSETDIVNAILHSLGTQALIPNSKGVPTKSGVFVTPRRSLFWRANSGGGKANGLRIKGNPAGTADILGCVLGRLVCIEVKDEKGKQSVTQAAWQTIVEAAGGIYAICRTPQAARSLVIGLEQV